MVKSGMNLQDSFLNQVRKDNTEIMLVLLDGTRLTGYVRGFDNFTVIVSARGNQHLIYKHAIAQLISRRPTYTEVEREASEGVQATEPEAPVTDGGEAQPAAGPHHEQQPQHEPTPQTPPPTPSRPEGHRPEGQRPEGRRDDTRRSRGRNEEPRREEGGRREDPRREESRRKEEPQAHRPKFNTIDLSQLKVDESPKE